MVPAKIEFSNLIKMFKGPVHGNYPQSSTTVQELGGVKRKAKESWATFSNLVLTSLVCGM